MNDQDFYLDTKRHLAWYWWLMIGLAGILLLGAVGLVVALGAQHFSDGLPAETMPVATLVPTFTPRPMPTETPSVLTLSVRPWTDDTAPVGLVEVTLSLPVGSQARGEHSRTVSHEPPSGFRYWRGDLLRTRQGLGWSGAKGGEVRWYLFREPGAVLPATLEVTVDGQRLAIELQPATPTTVSAVLEESR